MAETRFGRKTFLAGLLLPLLPGFSAVMPQRIIPSSGEKIPAVGLGTWQTFDTSSETEIKNLDLLVREFVRLGGSLIDSSPMYGNAESVVGTITSAIDARFFLATKVWTSGEQQGQKQIRQSMRKMQTEKLDLLQIHNLSDWKTQLRTLNKLKASGKIRYSGITHYTTSAFAEMEKIMKTETLDFIQIPYSIVTPGAEKRILPLALDKNIAVLVNRPFEGGDLFREIKNKPVPEFARAYGSWAQIFLKYILSHPAVTCVIPATTKISHLQQNMQSAQEQHLDAATKQKLLSYFTGKS